MRLLVLRKAAWTVLGVVDQRGTCAVADFLDELVAEAGADGSQVMALLDMAALKGPPHNERQSRHLDGPIWEIKTTRGVRVLYFCDEGQLVVCTAAVRKCKPAELRRLIRRATQVRREYVAAKVRGAIEIMEET